MKFWVKRFRRFIWGHFRFVGWSNKGDFKRLRNKLHDQSWDLWKIWSSKKWSTLIVFFSPSDETCIWIQRKYEIIALGSDRNFRILMIINKFIQKSIFYLIDVDFSTLNLFLALMTCQTYSNYDFFVLGLIVVDAFSPNSYFFSYWCTNFDLIDNEVKMVLLASPFFQALLLLFSKKENWRKKLSNRPINRRLSLKMWFGLIDN